MGGLHPGWQVLDAAAKSHKGEASIELGTRMLDSDSFCLGKVGREDLR